MKKYLPGIVATLLAFAAVAFTNAPKRQMIADGKETAPLGDPCASANKKWFLINVLCEDQAFLADITSPDNYTLSNASDAWYYCMGTECVCAIYACSTTSGKPIITSGTSIYAALYEFYYYGANSGLILMKDRYWGRQSQ